MDRVENTVFLSYRRTNAPWALAIWQNLTHNKYDVFLDFDGTASGDFKGIVIENIRARAHFLILLTPSALDRVRERGDLLRREIEAALENKRNIVPLMLEGFKFDSPTIASQLKGSLAPLKSYNALSVPAEFFDEAMTRLRKKYLNVPRDMVLHPTSRSAERVAKSHQAAASSAPAVSKHEMSAQHWFELGFNTSDHDEEIRFFSKAISRDPKFAVAFYNRGLARYNKGDFDGAIADYSQSIRLERGDADDFFNRALAYSAKGHQKRAIRDYDEAIGLNPFDADILYNRGLTREACDDLKGAQEDYSAAIRLKPKFSDAFIARGNVRAAQRDVVGALSDYKQAIRLKPTAIVYYNRALLWEKKKPVAAIADLRRYLKLSGRMAKGDQEEIQQWINKLKKKL